MIEYTISTTGTVPTVSIPDIGVSLTHPESVELSAATSHPIRELLDNDYINAALLAGELVKTAKQSDLLINRLLSPLTDPLISDFTIIGLRKESPSYDKGRKLQSLYKCITEDIVVVSKTFSDVIDPITSLLSGIQVQFDWYSEDGTIGLTKTEVVKSLNKYEAATEQRKRRERAIDYLVAGSAGTPVEPYMTFLFDRYYAEVQKFKDRDNTELLSIMANETDPTTLAYLALDIPQGDGSYTNTVQEIITYQIS